MKATLLLRERIDHPDGALIEIKVWQVPELVPSSEHHLKYSMVYIVDGARIVGFDNERGKGDHRYDRDGEGIDMKKRVFVGGTFDEAAVRVLDVYERASRGEKVEPQDNVTFVSWGALSAVMTDKRHEILRHLHAHPTASIRRSPEIWAAITSGCRTT